MTGALTHPVSWVPQTDQVKTIQIGKLELPVQLLQCGEQSCPYLSHYSITAEVC